MYKAFKKFLTQRLIIYLEKPSPKRGSPPTHSIELLKASLKVGDVLLVEGQQRFSTAIKYLTQTNWSHAALYIGNGELIEADLKLGVIKIDVETYTGYHTRICRPVELDPDDLDHIIEFIKDKQGLTYDIKNIIDLLRYLLPLPFMPSNWRSRILSFGSNDPTKVICSSVIAQAFHNIHYPINPIVSLVDGQRKYKKRHISFYVPSDFDRSPYFKIIKPTLTQKFKYKETNWEH